MCWLLGGGVSIVDVAGAEVEAGARRGVLGASRKEQIVKWHTYCGREVSEPPCRALFSPSRPAPVPSPP